MALKKSTPYIVQPSQHSMGKRLWVEVIGSERVNELLSVNRHDWKRQAGKQRFDTATAVVNLGSMLLPHSDFKGPRRNQQLWRYMDIGRYLALLSTSTLHFTRVDQFEDKWEGEYPDLTKKAIRQFCAAHKLDVDRMLTGFYCCKQSVFTNCWHESNHESAAMWRLYGERGSNLAIVSTLEKLTCALRDEPHEIFCGKVQYMDYKNGFIPFRNYLIACLRKRQSFVFESEVRLLMLDGPTGFATDKNAALKAHAAHKVQGIDTKAHLEDLIGRVLVSPDARDWYVNAVKDATAKYGLSPDLVSRSTFNDGPLR